MESAEPRKLDRKHVLLSAIVISPDGAQAARIRDLSSSGVHIFCERPPTIDSDVIFKRGDVFAAARVAWSDKAEAGLEFYRELDPAQMARKAPDT